MLCYRDLGGEGFCSSGGDEFGFHFGAVLCSFAAELFGFCLGWMLVYLPSDFVFLVEMLRGEGWVWL